MSAAAEAEFSTLHPNLLLGLSRAFDILESRRRSHPVPEGLTGFYEFGLYRGFSFWFANNLAAQKGMSLEFHGFDSFEGLPESRVDIHRNWPPGGYACSLEQVQEYFKRWGMPLPFQLHKGWYSEGFFRSIEEKHPLPKAAIAVVDCDMYESAREVLAVLGGLLGVGTLLLFDDYNAFGGDPAHGERRALAEFERAHPGFQKKHLYSFGPYGETFEVIAVDPVPAD